MWSWGESNPRPSIGDRTRYDHSRVSGSRQPHRRVGWALGPSRGVFPPCQRSFTPSAVCPSCLHRFCCRVAVDRPRVPLPVAVTLNYLTGQAARARSSVLASLWVPRFRSLGNSGRTTRPLPSASKPISPVVCATTPEGRRNVQVGSQLSITRSPRVQQAGDTRPRHGTCIGRPSG